MKSSAERDASIERLLRQTLRAPENTRRTDSCLDPETLAAWADGGLSREALELAQSHVAGCVRCQTLLGTLTRVNAAVPGHAPERASRGWLGWLVPLTAAAVGVTAVAVWVAVPRNTETRLPQAREEQAQAVDQQKGPTPAEVEDRGNAVPNAPSAVGALTGEAKPGEPQSVIAREEAGDAATKIDSLAGAPTQELRRDAARLEADGAKSQPAPLAAAAGPVSPPPLEERVTVTTLSGAAESPVVEIASPDPAVRWRITGSAVQRSTNGGSSWAAVSVGFQGQLTAGSAPSVSVCWLVGRGMVLLSTDGGGSWRRVAFPEPTDLSAVRASDARVALVTTSDGRTFGTNDGGLSWVPAAPQGF